MSCVFGYFINKEKRLKFAYLKEIMKAQCCFFGRESSIVDWGKT